MFVCRFSSISNNVGRSVTLVFLTITTTNIYTYWAPSSPRRLLAQCGRNSLCYDGVFFCTGIAEPASDYSSRFGIGFTKTSHTTQKILGNIVKQAC